MLITIVTYNPEEEQVIKNIRKIKEKDSRNYILIIDNNSRKIPNSLTTIADYFLKFDKNYGLGKAYNTGIKIAKDLGENYIMFLDQDTVILDNFNLSKVVIEAEKLREYQHLKSSILSINIDNAVLIKKIKGTNFYLAKIVVNSGMIVDIEYAYKNPFMENLFLDRLDFEYTYRAVKQGYFPLVYTEKMISHSPGEGVLEYKRLCGKIIKFLKALHTKYSKSESNGKPGHDFYYSNFLRYYLMLRNDVYLFVRRRIYLDFWKTIIVDVLRLCEVLGYRNAIGLILRAIRYGLFGELERDNEYLFM